MAPDDRGEESHHPPPHPLDRIWMHPSELGGVAAPVPRRRRWRPGIVTAMIAGLTVGIGTLAFAGFLADVGSTSSSPVAGEVAVGADALAASVVAVTAAVPTGATRGSGVSLGDGQVVTSAHLLSDDALVTITDADGHDHPARVVGRDHASDLALLDVDIALPAAPLGRADLLAEETRVVAIAATDDGGHWVRAARLEDRHAFAETHDGEAMFAGLLGTDAPTTPEHAGGALVDGEGAVVGILVAPPDTTMTGAAVPIEKVTGVCDQIRRKGTVDHGWLGIVGVDAHPGVLVRALVEEGPGDAAGVRVGDVVLGVGDAPINGMGELAATIRARRPGDDVSLQIVRNGKEKTVEVTLATLEPDSRATP